MLKLFSDAQPRYVKDKIIPDAPIYIGVDPGASGCIAALQITGTQCPGTWYPSWSRELRMPASPSSISVWLLKLTREVNPKTKIYAAVEKVQGWYGGARFKTESGDTPVAEGQPAHTMFEFGRNYGVLQGVLESLWFTEGKDLVYSIPRTWQKALGVTSTKRDFKGAYAAHKKKLREFAKGALPAIQDKIINQTADAYLLAVYAYTAFRGK